MINYKLQIKKKGFTLLELLVVVSIMVILITMGMSSFATSQKKGRDAKRKSDLKEIQSSLEQYYSVCSFSYPVPTDFYSQGIICTSPSIAIMPTLPSDPRGTPYYCGPTPGAGNCTATDYTICTTIESESITYYCVSNQQ